MLHSEFICSFSLTSVQRASYSGLWSSFCFLERHDVSGGLFQIRAKSPNSLELTRTHSNSLELARTHSKSRELFYDGKMECGVKNPMKYEEWSKSLELARTLTPDFSATELQRNRREDFEQKETKGRKSQETFGRSPVRGRETARTTFWPSWPRWPTSNRRESL
jgi:hypothetical protein